MRLLFISSLVLCILGTHSETIQYGDKKYGSASDPHEMPDTMEMTLELDDQIMILNLVKNPNIPSDLPVFVGTKYATRMWSPGDHGQYFAAYNDLELGASITIQLMKKNGRIEKSIRGVIPLGGEVYSLSPAGSSTPSGKVGTSRRVRIAGESYHMDLEERDTEFDCSAYSGKKSSTGGYTSRQSSAYTADVLLVTDYAIYKKWYELSTETTPSAKGFDAEHNITFYFVHVLNGIDRRYQSIQPSDFSISIRLVGLYIAKDQSESPFTEGQGIRLEFDGDVYTDMYKGLSAFQDWEAKFAAENGLFFDQATLFVGNILYDGTMIEGKPSIKSGLANIGSFCNIGNPISSGKADSVSICRDKSIYASVNTGAHEMAHNFGSQHDGQMGNTCDSDEQFIMAVAPGGLTDETAENPYKFSSCSIKYMKDFLTGLTSKDPGNCLLKNSDKPTVTGRRAILTRQESNQIPGEVFSIDQQCQHMVDKNSYYCAGQSRDDKLCYSLVCFDSSRNQCISTNEMRAYQRTVCGNGMWCYMGKCTASSEAPSTPKDKCIYGERKDTVHFAEDVKLACKELNGHQAWRCYQEDTQGECCETCPMIADKTKPGCEYGNHDPTYCAANQIAKNCYDDEFSALCCEFCAPKTNAVKDCEHGDKASWCTSMTADRCYNDGDICCESCAKFKISDVEGCEYGDKESYCKEYDVHDVCGAYPEDCCLTCRDFGENSKRTKKDYAVNLLKSLLKKYQKK